MVKTPGIMYYVVILGLHQRAPRLCFRSVDQGSCVRLLSLSDLEEPSPRLAIGTELGDKSSRGLQERGMQEDVKQSRLFSVRNMHEHVFFNKLDWRVRRQCLDE